VQLRGTTEEDMIENVQIMVNATENMRAHGRTHLQKVRALTSHKKSAKSKVQFAETEEGKREEAKNMRNLNLS